MVIGNNRFDLDSSTNEVVTHDSLESGLSTLEVRPSDEALVFLSILNDTWVECVLRRTVQVKNLFFNASNAEQDRGWNGNVSLDLRL